MDSNPAPSKRTELPRYGPWLALLSVLAIGAWFVLLRPWMKRSQARARAEEQLGMLQQCLIGNDAAPSAQRFRRRLIGAQLAPGKANERWPQRCAPIATKLRLALEQLLAGMPQRCSGKVCCPGDQRCERINGLRVSSDTMRSSLRNSTPRFETLQTLLELARNAKLDVPAPSLATTALPPEAKLYTPQESVAVWQGQHHALRFATAGLDKRLLIVRQEKLARLCTFSGLLGIVSAPLVACSNLPAKVPVAQPPNLLTSGARGPARLLHRAQPQTGGAPRTVVRDARTGEALLDIRSGRLDVAALSAGRVAALSTDSDARTSLHLADGQGKPQLLEVSLGESTRFGPTLAADTVIWGQGAPTDEQPTAMKVLARRIEAGETAALSETRELGTLLTMSVDSVETCHTAKATWLLLRAAPHGHQTKVALTVRSNTAAGSEPGRWSPLLLRNISSASFGFSCAGDQASLLHTELFGQRGGRGRLVIKRTRCTRTKCAPDSTELELVRRSSASPFLLGDLGSAVALLWQSALGDIRLRVAPLDKLSTCSVTSLFDDDKHGGFAWDASSSLHVHGGTGLLVVQARPSKSVHDWSLHTFQIDATGKAILLRSKAPTGTARTPR